MESTREHPKLIGDRTTAKVLAALIDRYDCVLLPFGENQRYDLLVEDGDRFIKIQCKTGRLRKGAVIFPTCSVTYHHPARATKTESYKHDYRGQADYFGVYCPETDSVYLVPVADVGRVTVSLRITAPLNAQSKRIRWAIDYEVQKRERTPSSTLFEPQPRYSVVQAPG